MSNPNHSRTRSPSEPDDRSSGDLKDGGGAEKKPPCITRGATGRCWSAADASSLLAHANFTAGHGPCSRLQLLCNVERP